MRSLRVAHIIKIGQWDRDKYWSVLNVDDQRGEAWQVSADRDGTWRIKHHPSRYDDDARVYADGNVAEGEHSYVNSNEIFVAAKKAARKHLTNLLAMLAKEEV